MKIKKGDTVQIMLGKDAGKTGKVFRVLGKDSKVLVEEINMYKRHIKKMAGHEGTIINVAKPVDISNVELICPACKKPTRVGFKISGKEKGSISKTRICKKCQKEIDNVKA